MAKRGDTSARRKSIPPGKPGEAQKLVHRAGRDGRSDADVRRRMIAEAAYFRAEARGFQGGDALRDWLEAEAEVDAVLRSGGGRAP